MEKLQVLEPRSDTKFEQAERVAVLYSEEVDHSSSSDTEKLEIVEDKAESGQNQDNDTNKEKHEEEDCAKDGEENVVTKSTDDVLRLDEVQLTEVRQDGAAGIRTEHPEDTWSDEAHQVMDENSAKITEDMGSSTQDNNVQSGDLDSEMLAQENLSQQQQTPIVITKDTLVRNLDTTQMVTSETQTYEAVATVTEFTENIVAETVLDDENANVEYTPEVVPETIAGFEGVDVDRMEEPEKSTEGEGTHVTEMDCQTEMDPELLALIEAAEQIEAQQQEAEQYEEEGSQGEESESEESEQEEAGLKDNE